jgi:CSLREA domain-containing protein
VNSVADTDDGACASAAGGCTLREAILAANAAAGRDTIRFDPAVFPLGMPQTIAVQSALPHLVEPAGNVVDGRGASVVIDGAALDPLLEADGLVLASGGTAPLSRPEVRNVSFQGFGGIGLSICGGAPPSCEAEVSRALVSAVFAKLNVGDGISVDGRPNQLTRVERSVASQNQRDGIRVNGGNQEDLVKASVADCSAFANGRRGINLNAGRDNVASTVLRGVASENGGTGINVNAGRETIKPRVLQSVASGNGTEGVVLNGAADPGVSGGLVKENTAAGNVTVGISAEGVGNKLLGNRVLGNAAHGIELRLPGGSNRIEKNRASSNTLAGIRVENGNGGNRLKQNVALGNGPDLYDEAADCDFNVWRDNEFGWTNQACIE